METPFPTPDRDGLNDEDINDVPPTTPDPNDEIPVPIMMYPSEIDERAQVVDKLREDANTNRDEELGLQP